LLGAGPRLRPLDGDCRRASPHQPGSCLADGAQALSRGGSAIDAAIAANAVLAVTEPMKNGLVATSSSSIATPPPATLQGSTLRLGPRNLSPAFSPVMVIRRCRRKAFTASPCQGVVEGWARIHQRYGKLPWKDLFHDAIAYAENGFPVAEAVAETWNEAPHIGRFRLTLSPFAFSSLAASRRGKVNFFVIPAWHRHSVFWRNKADASTSEIASAILKTSQHLGGEITAQDLAPFPPMGPAPYDRLPRLAGL